MENKKRRRVSDPEPAKRPRCGNMTRRIIEAIVGFRPAQPIPYNLWLRQLDRDGILYRVAKALGIPTTTLKTRYLSSSVHKYNRPLAQDVSSQQYWNLWTRMYRWDSIEDLVRESRAKYGSNAASELSHSETEASPDEDPAALDETLEKDSDAIEENQNSPKDTPKDSPGENLKHEGVPRAIYIGKYDRGYGSLTELRYNAETLTAELYLPGDTDVLPQIHHTRAGNICADMGYGRVMVLTANRHMPVKVYHETIQVAPDRDPAFLRLRIVYEKV
jgi:hypothetical protein